MSARLPKSPLHSVPQPFNESPPSCPQLLTISEAAARLAIRPVTLRVWIRQGQLPARKIGRAVRVRELDLAAFVEARVFGLPKACASVVRSQQPNGVG